MEEGFQTVNLHGCASGVIATPVIGQNGNWFIGNKDTGVCAKGVEGDKGENGQQGSKGDQGDVGPAGAQGIQGIQGVPGEQGIKGDRGDIGEQGAQGLQGAQGEQGPKGDKGDIGPMGPQGEQGPKGTDADSAELERLSGEVVKVTGSLNNLYSVDLWTNPNPKTNFAAQTVSLAKSIKNFKFYEVQFVAQNNTNTIITSGKIPVDFSCYAAFAHNRNYTRSGTPNNTAFIFGEGYSYFTNGGGYEGIYNANCIPYKIIGYKM